VPHLYSIVLGLIYLLDRATKVQDTVAGFIRSTNLGTAALSALLAVKGSKS